MTTIQDFHGRRRPQQGRSSIWPALKIIAIATIASSSSLCSGAEEIDEQWVARLKNEAIESWRAAEHATQNFAVTLERTYAEKFRDAHGDLQTKNVEETLYLCWDSANARRLYQINSVNSRGARVVVRRVVNPDYRFVVGHPPEVDRWKLHSGDKPAGGEDFGEYSPFEDEYRWYVQSSFRVRGVPLWDLLQGGEMRLTTVKQIADGGRIRIAADYVGEEAAWRPKGASFWAEVDPNESWYITTGGMTIPATGQEDVQEATYHRVPSFEVPFPKTFETRMTLPRDDYMLVKSVVFSVPGKCETSEPFRLAYYGIDEATLATTTARSTGRLMAMAIGLTLLIVFYALLKRRKDAADQS